MEGKKSKKKKQEKKPTRLSKDNPPHLILVDLTPETYQDYKNHILKDQHPVVRPHVNEYIKWLKDLDALSVYDALEKGETVKDRYEQMRFNPIRLTVAASRGLLKASADLRAKANRALSLELSRLVLRFENPAVWQVLKEFDPQEEYLRRNIQSVKQMFGLVEVPKD